jgi:hypothetical protein
MDVIRETGPSITDTFTYMYFGFGLVIVMLAAAGFIAQQE